MKREYSSPAVEIVNIEIEGSVMSGSGDYTPTNSVNVPDLNESDPI